MEKNTSEKKDGTIKQDIPAITPTMIVLTKLFLILHTLYKEYY